MKEMQALRENGRDLCLILTIPLSNIIYFFLNSADRGYSSLVTDLDRSIPFLKIFILPYLAWYFFIFGALVYFCLKDKKIYYQTLGAIHLGLLISYGFYFFFQTGVPRPELVSDDFLTVLTAFIYNNDRPYNAFPSLHVLLSFLMMKAIQKSQVKNHFNVAFIYTLAILIMLATQFVKQHVILDLLSAVVIGNIVFDLVYHLNVESLRVWFKNVNLGLNVKKKPEG